MARLRHRAETSIYYSFPNMAPKLESVQVFDEMRKRLEDQPDLPKKVNGVFLWVITKDGKEQAKYSKLLY